MGRNGGLNPEGQTDSRAGSGHPNSIREPGVPQPDAGQAGREQAEQEHSGLLATQAEAAVVAAAAAGPERVAAGRRCSGGVRGPGPPQAYVSVSPLVTCREEETPQARPARA